MSKRLLPLCVLCCVLAPLSAEAGTLSDVSEHVVSWLGVDHIMGFSLKADAPAPAAMAPMPTPMLAAQPVSVGMTKEELAALAKPIAIEQPALPEPSTEKGFKHFYCVEYARLRSGLALFGDAKYWWRGAKSLYARASQPVEEAVMVFSGSKRLRRGHVAVVTNIVSPREIRVDQANWENHGEIDHSTPVLDVSAANDWSKVRVWDVASRQFGAHVYAISGFIMKGLDKRASAD